MVTVTNYHDNVDLDCLTHVVNIAELLTTVIQVNLAIKPGLT